MIINFVIVGKTTGARLNQIVTLLKDIARDITAVSVTVKGISENGSRVNSSV